MQSESTPHEPSSANAGSAPTAPVGGSGDRAPGREERQWAMLCHVSAMLMYVTAIGGLVAPFVIWLLKREEMPFVADQGKETINFQITILLALAASVVLMLVVVGFVVFWALLAFHFIVTLVAAVKVTEGVAYRYPFCWRVLK
jgi:uncharacterized Tic20 family protein